MIKKVAVFVVLGVFLAVCASSGQKKLGNMFDTGSGKAIFHSQGLDRVWAAVVKTLKSKTFSIIKEDKAKGVIIGHMNSNLAGAGTPSQEPFRAGGAHPNEIAGEASSWTVALTARGVDVYMMAEFKLGDLLNDSEARRIPELSDFKQFVSQIQKNLDREAKK